MGKQPFRKLKAQVRQNIFFGRLGQNSYKVMHSPGGLEAPCHNFLGSPNSYFTLEWTYATVVSMDFSLVVRISKNAFPSVHLSKFQIEIQHVHIESYTENGLFLFCCLFLAEEFRLVPTKVYDCFADVVMWFPPILSRVEYPNWPQQSGPFSAGQTARSTPCTPAASYAWRSRLQALHIVGCGQPVLLWPYHSY